MSVAWERIVAWGAARAPEMIEGLNACATEKEIEDAEKRLSMEFPEALRDCLLRNNGETVELDSGVFADMGVYHSTQQIVDAWEQRQEIAAQVEESNPERDVEQLVRDGIIFVEGAVQPVFFSKKWVPILDRNGDVFWAIDYAPAPGGVAGQVIEVDWEGCTWKVLASSFDEFLENYATDLEGGAYQVIDGLPTKV